MERLAELRESQALTLRDLAEKSGVDANTINQVELGHRKPRPSTLRKLARALEVNVEEFFKEPALAGKAEAPETGPSIGDEPALPQVLRPRSVGELLERAGLETHWFTLPDDDFNRWWLDVSWKEAIERFWQINAEFRIIAAETTASIQGRSTVAPELQSQLKKDYLTVFRKHFGAARVAPGKGESEEEFYERQRHGELRRSKRIELEREPEDAVAHAG